MRILTSFAAVAASVLLVSGCSGSVSVGSDSVSKSDVESQITSQLEEQTGQTPDDVSCPDDLDAKVDATMTCVLTAGTDTVDVDVTVTSVKDGDVAFDIEVADQVN